MPIMLSLRKGWNWEALTRHAVPFGCWEGCGVHVGDAARSEVVVLLGGEVEVPVGGVVGEES
jgi:hypothetical protein